MCIEEEDIESANKLVNELIETYDADVDKGAYVLKYDFLALILSFMEKVISQHKDINKEEEEEIPATS